MSRLRAHILILPAMAGLFTLFFMGILPSPGPAQDGGAPPIEVTWEAATVSGEETKTLVYAIRLTPEPGWYFYTNLPGQEGRPLEIKAENNAGRPLPVLYPPGENKVIDSKNTDVYSQTTWFFIPLPADNKNVTAVADISLLLCSDNSCYPFYKTLEMKPDQGQLPPAGQRPWWGQWRTALPKPSQPDLAGRKVLPRLSPRSFTPGLEVSGLGKALTLAFLAGLILNLMPCVLPVLSLKIRAVLSFQGPESVREQQFRRHNVLFALGILTFFLIFSSLAAFVGLAWGQLFQSETALLVLITLIFAMGLSMLGVYQLPAPGISLKQQQTSGFQAFFTGVLATVLATPCSGPFLGGILAWTLFQTPLIIGLVFVFIGAGMASPYLLAALFPKSVWLLPRPGMWMKYLEHILGILLLGTCIYLMALLPKGPLIRVLIMLWFTGLAALIWGKWTTLSQSAKKRWTIRAISVLLLVTGLTIGLNKPETVEDPWRTYDAEMFSRSIGSKPMLVEFTADWCPNCKFLEQTVLTAKNLKSWKEQYGLLLIKVDLTRENTDGRKLLQNLNSRSIPLVALFPAGPQSSEPVILRDLFTTKQLERALEEVFSK